MVVIEERLSQWKIQADVLLEQLATTVINGSSNLHRGVRVWVKDLPALLFDVAGLPSDRPKVAKLAEDHQFFRSVHI